MHGKHTHLEANALPVQKWLNTTLRPFCEVQMPYVLGKADGIKCGSSSGASVHGTFGIPCDFYVSLASLMFFVVVSRMVLTCLVLALGCRCLPLLYLRFELKHDVYLM